MKIKRLLIGALCAAAVGAVCACSAPTTLAASTVTDTTYAGTSILGGANTYSSEEGTPAAATTTNTAYEEKSVAEVHSGYSVYRYPSFNTKSATNTYVIYPNSKVVMKYKFVMAEGSTTNAEDIKNLRPVIRGSVNGAAHKEYSAENSLVVGEWATCTFDMGQYVTTTGPINLVLGQIRPMGICSAYTYEEQESLTFNASGSTFGNSTVYHVDADDCLYIESMYSVRTDYTVSFDVKDGVGKITDAVSVGGNPVVFPEETPTKEGFVFAGWSESSDSDICVDMTSYAPGKDITLYAVYTEQAETYEISFDLDGGTSDGSESVESVTYDGISAIVYPTDPVKQYRFFAGWSTEKGNAEKTIDPDSWVPAADTTLYAVWTNEKVIVTAAPGKIIKALNKYNDAEIGTYTHIGAYENFENVVEIHTANDVLRCLSGNMFNVNQTFTDAPLKPGMKLVVDYKYVPDTSVAAEDTPTDVAALTALKPQIVLTSPTVATFSANENIVANAWAKASFEIGDYVTAANTTPLTTGRIFMLSINGSGAATGTKLGIEGGTAIHVDPSDTLYLGDVSLIQKCYIVTFNLNGGQSNGSSEDVTFLYEGNTVEFPASAPVREGYEFLGWGRTSVDTEAMKMSDFAPSSDITLYAVWKEKGVAVQSTSKSSTFVKGVISDSSGNAGATKSTIVIDGYDGVVLQTKSDTLAPLTPDCWSFNSSFDNATATSRTRFVVTYKYVPADDTQTELDTLLAAKPVMRINAGNGWSNWLEAEETVVRDNWATAVFDFSKMKNSSETESYFEEGVSEEISHMHLRILGYNASGAPTGTKLDFAGTGFHVDPDDKVYIGEGKLMYKYDYEITFDANGGGGGDAYEHIITAFGGAKFDGVAPSRVGYTFLGWAKSADASPSDILSAGFMPESDITLYAVWEQDPDYVFEDLATLYPTTGGRGIAASGAKIYSDSETVMTEALPSYLDGAKYSLDAAAEKDLRVIEKGWVYIFTPQSGDGSDAENLVNLEFNLLGTIGAGGLSEDISESYSIYGKYFDAKAQFTVGAHTFTVANIVVPDDSLIAPEIITFPAQKLEEHPEYSEYLNGNRKFGGCPSITQTPDGKLWLSITSGGTGEDMYNYAMLYCSEDGGITWGEPVLVADPETPVRTSEPYVWCDPDGKLWFWWSQMFVASASNSDGRMGMFIISSADGGNTWTSPKRLFHGFSNQNPIVLSDGKWAMPVNIWNNNSAHSELNHLKKPHLYLSSDKGETWEFAGAAAECSNSWFWENSVVERKDGSLVMYYRTISAGVEMTVSTDGGKTWSAGENAGISLTSARTATVKLSDGSLAVVSHDDALANGARTHITVWLSEDEGETFPYSLMLDEKGWYPSLYEGNDGFLYIIYDRNRGDGSCAMLAKVTADDIKAGKLVSDGSMIKHLAIKGNSAELPHASVSFDTDGGNTVSDMIFRTSPADLTAPFAVRTLPAAQKAGFKFLGWATEKGGNVVYSALEEYTPQSMDGAALFAVYEELADKKVTLSITTSRGEGVSANRGSFARITFTQNGEIKAQVEESEQHNGKESAFETYLAPGEYSFLIEKNGYLPHKGTATVTDSGIDLGQIELIPGDIKGSYDDLCGDGVVDIDDFIRVLRAFSTSAEDALKAVVDIDEDGVPTVTDLALVKTNLGKSAS